MPKKLYRPPEHLIKVWPEVFDDLYMNTMPVAYLETLILEFNDGRIWEIDVGTLIKKEDHSKVSKKLLSILEEYHNDISKVDFTIDIKKLKSDLQSKIKNIL